MSVGVEPVVTRPPPLSPLHTALVGDDSQISIALFAISPSGEPLQTPCGSTVPVIQASGPLLVAVGVCLPKPATPTAAPAGNAPFAGGRATALTAGPVRSSGETSASTATSSGSACPVETKPGCTRYWLTALSCSRSVASGAEKFEIPARTWNAEGGARLLFAS